jgi:ADP-ribose pyrophosphatase
MFCLCGKTILEIIFDFSHYLILNTDLIMMRHEKKVRTVTKVNARSFSVNLDEVQLPSGRITERIRVEHPDASALVPILNDGRIILVKQYRYSIKEETLEIPAGKIDPGETPEHCVRREFEEETGLQVSNVEFLFRYVPAIGYSSEVLYIYKGTGISSLENSTISSDEISKIKTFSIDELKTAIKTGLIKDGKTLLALYYLYGDYLHEKAL